MTRLLCFADLHLGAGSQYPGRLKDQARVLDQIATLAFDRDVAGILIAGDVFEGPQIPPEQLEVFARFVEGCRVMEIPILAITGNSRHDDAVRETNGLAIFNHIDGIDVHSQSGWVEFAGCAVALMPWAHPGRLIARLGRDVARDEVNVQVGDLLIAVARDLHDTIAAMPLSSKMPRILLGHWSVAGTSLPTGLPVDDLREPVIPIDPLEEIGFDAIVMGHIHRGQPIGARGFYTGSPLPLNFGEEHVDHGIWILDTDQTLVGHTRGPEFVAVESPRFLTIDLGSNADVDWQLGHSIAAIVGGDTDQLDDAIIRVRFTATAEQMQRIDIATIREPLLQVARSVKIEPTIMRAQRARVAGVDEQLDEIAALEMWMQADEVAEELREVLRSKTREYLEVA